MRTLAVALAFCAALGAQRADDLDHLFQAHQWFELRSAVTDRSPALMRAAVATAFNDPDTAERLLRDVIRSAPASDAADEAYGMLSQIYLRSGQYRRWQTSYRQWVAAIPIPRVLAPKKKTRRNWPGDRIRSTAVRDTPFFGTTQGISRFPYQSTGRPTTISSTPARGHRS